jgi:hypothetical protein
LMPGQLQYRASHDHRDALLPNTPSSEKLSTTRSCYSRSWHATLLPDPWPCPFHVPSLSLMRQNGSCGSRTSPALGRSIVTALLAPGKHDVLVLSRQKSDYKVKSSSFTIPASINYHLSFGLHHLSPRDSLLFYRYSTQSFNPTTSQHGSSSASDPICHYASRQPQNNVGLHDLPHHRCHPRCSHRNPP